MRSSKISPTPRDRTGGFTLAAVLVVMAAILLLTVGLLALVGIERKTARSYVDVKRAEWMAESGMEDFRVKLRNLTDNDEYLVISQEDDDPTDAAKVEGGKDRLEYLYVARPQGGGDSVDYQVTPLFSTADITEDVTDLKELQGVSTLRDEETADFETLPWADEARVNWVEVENDDDEVVGRYAYWVEDLQGRVNLDGGGDDWDTDALTRNQWPFPAPGVPVNVDGPGIEMNLNVLDPAVADAEEPSDLGDRLVDGRPLMVSPKSTLAGAGFLPPLVRDEVTGRLSDESADAVERGVTPKAMPYEERPVIPHAPGIQESMAGRPKLNLNELLAQSTDSAIQAFKGQIEDSLPEFEKRAGGFPDDYLGTLAAGALDYADADSAPIIKAGVRGLDANPLLSEIFMQIHFRGLKLTDSRKSLLWTIKVYAELWNMTNQRVTGNARISYENGLSTSGIGSLPQGQRFDDPRLLDNPDRTTHTLTKEGGRYWSLPIPIDLQPDQYVTNNFVTVDYEIDVGPRYGPGSVFIDEFTLFEELGAAGMSLRWNEEEIDRVDKIIRYSVSGEGEKSDLNFEATVPRYVTKAAIPGHSYGQYRDFVDNMGDPRISYYLRSQRWALGLNAYPGNASPNRRNVRRWSIYDKDGPNKSTVYGRVLPSEWPDGGHNSQVGTWSISGDDSVEPTSAKMIGTLPALEEGTAPQRISNAGRFYSATELGRVFDPVMWEPSYGKDKAQATSSLLAGSITEDRWPRVNTTSTASSEYGGGTTLCIGNPENPAFNNPSQHAARLLDLFHAGNPRAQDRDDYEGPLVTIDGKININTASRDALRVVAAGLLGQDKQLSRVVRTSHRGAPYMMPTVGNIEMGVPTDQKAADIVADAIIDARPITSAYDLARVEQKGYNHPDDAAQEQDGHELFGNRNLYELGPKIEWSDAAAEELFARMYESTTVRSRNFRVWVVGQALAPKGRDSTSKPRVLAESRKVFTVFADPGERTPEGEIDIHQYRPTIVNENDF
ncbi:hypothetical protein [Haloferula sargassicola]|uniref:Uncharacterized protein n=1 Tax=Haloferula sargassicola TaxID=490096 RepID=A0ABP9UH98_9BACT